MISKPILVIPSNPIALTQSSFLSTQSKIRHEFSELWDLERKFGSIISGAIQSMLSKKKSHSNSKTKHGSFLFLGGMQTLTNELCKEIGAGEVNLQSKVLEMSYFCGDNNSNIGNWSIYCGQDQNKQSFDAVIMTVSKT
ncbi:hypothetical protein LXL04_003719 [Taraxacum kok-saghyz]